MRIRPWQLWSAVALAAGPAGAQQSASPPVLHARTELVTASGYLWRGITRHRSPVMQLFGTAGRNSTKLDIDLSAWASGITGDCGRPSCPEGTGVRVADVNASLMAAYLLGDTRFALGANVYRFDPAPYRPEGAAATVEIVGSIRAIPSRHIQLALSAWLDVDDVDGLYTEVTGTMPLTLSKAQSPKLFFTATLGLNQGQNTTDDGHAAQGYFIKNGFTHVALEADYVAIRPVVAGQGVTLQLFVRVQGNFDGATKASVWPFDRTAAEQQVIAGVVLGPLVSYRSKVGGSPR